jgi:hypothetical protein
VAHEQTDRGAAKPSAHPHDDGQMADQRGGWSSVPWSMAAQAAAHCLTGCAIGEVAGMVIGTAAGLHNAATVVLSVVLAFAFGYALTMRGVIRAGVGVRSALQATSPVPGRCPERVAFRAADPPVTRPRPRKPSSPTASAVPASR